MGCSGSSRTAPSTPEPFDHYKGIPIYGIEDADPNTVSLVPARCDGCGGVAFSGGRCMACSSPIFVIRMTGLSA